jgi:hypothetical protein
MRSAFFARDCASHLSMATCSGGDLGLAAGAVFGRAVGPDENPVLEGDLVFPNQVWIEVEVQQLWICHGQLSFNVDVELQSDYSRRLRALGGETDASVEGGGFDAEIENAAAIAVASRALDVYGGSLSGTPETKNPLSFLGKSTD